VDFPLRIGWLRRLRAGTAVFCLLLILAVTGVQVLHHCTDMELSAAQHSGGTSLPGSAVCVICMTVQVAILAVASAVIAVSRLISIELPARAGVPPQSAACFALYVRPPPAF